MKLICLFALLLPLVACGQTPTKIKTLQVSTSTTLSGSTTITGALTLPVITGALGGTGVANAGKTLTLGGSFTLAGTTGSTINLGTGGTVAYQDWVNSRVALALQASNNFADLANPTTAFNYLLAARPLVSADITDASSGGQGSDDNGLLAKFTSDGDLNAANLSVDGFLSAGSSATQGRLVLRNTAGADITIAPDEADGEVSVVLATPKVSGRIQATLEGSATLDFVSTAAGGTSELTVSIPLAAVGDAVSVGAPVAAVPASGNFFGYVSSSGVVKVRFSNNNLTTSMDPASGVFKIRVLK